MPLPPHALASLFEAGRAAWPGVRLERGAFDAWCEAHLAPGLDLGKLDGRDAFIVAACVSSAPGAARAFIDGPLRASEPSITRYVSDPEARDELLHELSVHLLTPGPNDGDVPRLGHFDGRAPLRAWLRMVAARRAQRRAKTQGRLVSFDEVAFDRASESDPELSALKRTHREAILAIFALAIAELGVEDHNLLRLHYGKGTTLSDLAALYKTSRSSLHRRVESARAVLFETIAAHVRQRLRLSLSEQQSLLRVFHSELRDALGQVLKMPAPQP